MIIFSLVCLIIVLGYFLCKFYLRKRELEREYKPIIDIYDEWQKTRNKIDKLEKEYESKIEKLKKDYAEKRKIYSDLEEKISLYEDKSQMFDIGLYNPIYKFDTSEKYINKLEKNREKQKKMVKNGEAVYCNTDWTVGGSKAEGRKMTNRIIKLVLKAFNGQCDSIIKNVSWNNATKMEIRMEKVFEDINKLTEVNHIEIDQAYLDLKIEELRLAYEYEEKKREEKEEQRRIREQIREEEKVQRELERKQKELEEQERRESELRILLEQAYNQGKKEEAEKYQEEIAKLNETIENNKRAISNAQLTKWGRVYVISNIGSFGEDVYKIGMTRREDPMDRINELGDASVPFKFDVHAIIDSDNAPELESKLHDLFKTKSVNRINYRKEFFRVTLNEIEEAVSQLAGAEIEFTKIAEAREYRETQAILMQESGAHPDKDGDLLPETI